MLVLREQSEPFLEEDDHVLCHLVQLAQIAVCVHITKAGPYRLVDEEQVCKLVPRPVVVFQVPVLCYSVGANFHHGAVHGGAAGPAVEP